MNLRPRFLLPIILLFASLSLKGQANRPTIVSYVTAWTDPLPDPKLISHINYAFGHVNDTFDGIRVDNPERLKRVVRLREQAAHLKILLSIGGWGSGRFSEMAADPQKRMSFAKDCAKVVKLYKLDGIDIDWEYPTSSAAKISALPEDTDNYNLLMQDIRSQIGKSKLLTLASVADAQFIDFKTIAPIVDFVNVMMYDVGSPGKQHASLFRSELAGRVTLEEALAAHLKAGLPKNKIVMGIPFYGRGDKTSIPDYVAFRDLKKFANWKNLRDPIAKVPYLVNDQGKLILSYEDVESVQEKMKYIKQQGILGAMYWEFAWDSDDLALSKAIYEGLK